MDQNFENLRTAAMANAAKLSGFSESELSDAALRRSTVIVFMEAGTNLDLGPDAAMLFQDETRQAWTATADAARLSQWLSNSHVLTICRNELPDVKLLNKPC